MPRCTHRHGMRFSRRYEYIKIVLLNASQEQAPPRVAATEPLIRQFTGGAGGSSPRMRGKPVHIRSPVKA
jgi:hypothetical protein